MAAKFKVIRDTREKVGYWDFVPDDRCSGTIEKAVQTGDYTLVGYEDVLCIERKRNTRRVSRQFGRKTI